MSADTAQIADLRTRFREGKAELLARFGESRPTAPAAARLIRSLCKHVDQTLLAVWEHAAMPPGTALLAVGGYGRGELFPHSDVDVLVLLPPSMTVAGGALKTSIEAFITACWDIGLEIGSSVRTVGECIAMARSDVTVQTALLESRYLCGSRRVFASFRTANTQAMDAKAFLRAKTLEMEQRHRKFEDTPYSLEPNCKESPGGLRDLQVVIWVARAAGLGKTWSVLAAKGLITPFEVKQLNRNEGLLKLIRARLHIIAGRREDRLVFDLQTAIAESFGYTASRAQRASEKLMRRYYWAAKAVSQLNQILMLNIAERVEGSQDAPMRPINDKFLERGGMLEVASDDIYERDPHAILETFLVYQQTVGPKGLSARTLRALYNARDLMDSSFRHDPV
ncbi:MAG: nucleotidyltransferase domain-containing protein, partial [Burkholderiales bacterium]